VKRILVIANRTLCEQHLLDELHRRRDAGQVMFHLLVPASHPHGGWTDAQAETEAQAKLDEMLDTLAAAGIGATGDIGDANPVFATGDLIRRGETFDEIIISTLPAGVSRWLASNVVRRLRSYSDLPVTHVVAERVPLHA